MHMPTGSCIPAKPYLVTIFGAAGAGKSVLARAVAARLGDDVATRVPTDYFFVPRQPGEPLERYFARPLEWDWALLRERLALPMGSEVRTPDADFETFTRPSETGGLPMSIRPVMILDAMVPYPDADLLVRVDVPDAIRRARIVERDARWGTRVRDRWEHLEATWDAVPELIPHLVLDGTRPIQDNVARLVSVIGERGWKDRRDGR
jgi:uridine kinase